MGKLKQYNRAVELAVAAEDTYTATSEPGGGCKRQCFLAPRVLVERQEALVKLTPPLSL